MTPIEAHAALVAAEQALVDAQRARDEAAAQLEAALAGSGWHRMAGGFAPTATALYEHSAFESLGPQRLDDILATLAVAA